ncbi:hypothetical protein EDD16DRAFT_1571722 [Pisolithus croceorrhizus]|nr:hypothetical protein EDD16DRAFT_1571722 [Pisolithus croceorrhizus]
MGGDHKCPVCQATFTRPQHVARHMRSHTGDRPYKCQHCGDQFARSDLLSRHINKCHANEKPSPNAAGGKRKGSAAASRATTSKQACDQCVQLSLPCDGSNPCSKCVSRKCRCTYVKFHRQTAPIGPGHQPPRTVASSASSPVIGGSHPHLDDLILVPPPTSVPSMTTSIPDSLLSTQFSFNPAYPSASTVDLSSIPVSMAAPDVMTDKFRTHTDLLRRSGGSSSSPSTSIHPAATTGNNVFSGTYTSQSQPGWYSWGDPSSGSAGLFDASRFLPPLDDKDFPTGDRGIVPDVHRSISVIAAAPPLILFPPVQRRAAFICHSQARESFSTTLWTTRRANVGIRSVEMLLPLRNRQIIRPRNSSGPLQKVDFLPRLVSCRSKIRMPSLNNFSQMAVSFFSSVGVGGVMPHSPNATPMPARQASQPHQSNQQPFRDREAYVRTPLSGPGGDDTAAAYKYLRGCRECSLPLHLNLNLVPRRRGTRTGASRSPVQPSGGVSAENFRPSSSSSVSSLAHAFGPHQSLVKPPPLSNPSISLPIPSVHGHGPGGGSFGNLPRELPSRESSVASDGTGSSEGEVFRPSFKRLASQTLGPANSKRALMDRGAGGGNETIAVAVADGGGLGAGGNASKELLGTGNASMRPIAALPERARRTSEAGVA